MLGRERGKWRVGRGVDRDNAIAGAAVQGHGGRGSIPWGVLNGRGGGRTGIFCGERGGKGCDVGRFRREVGRIVEKGKGGRAGKQKQTTRTEGNNRCWGSGNVQSGGCTPSKGKAGCLCAQVRSRETEVGWEQWRHKREWGRWVRVGRG